MNRRRRLWEGITTGTVHRPRYRRAGLSSNAGQAPSSAPFIIARAENHPAWAALATTIQKECSS